MGAGGECLSCLKWKSEEGKAASRSSGERFATTLTRIARFDLATERPVPLFPLPSD